MLQRLRNRASEEQGFTLIELLVVILIIGILAAIALPTFLGQQKKGQDSSAKSNARNLVTHVESCFADAETYVDCAGANIGNLGTTGLELGSSPGQVTATSANATSFVVTAVSKAVTGGANHTFTITKTNGAGPTRTCTPAGEGGCKTNGSW